MASTQKEVAVDLKSILSSMKLSSVPSKPAPIIQDGFKISDDDVSDEDRFLSGLAAVLFNLEADHIDPQAIDELIADIDSIIENQVNAVLHHDDFQALECNWRGFQDLARNTDFSKNIQISMLDVTKEELFQDLELNATDLLGSDLFKKVYLSEYDQFGGAPYGAMIGLYDFNNTPDVLCRIYKIIVV